MTDHEYADMGINWCDYKKSQGFLKFDVYCGLQW